MGREGGVYTMENNETNTDHHKLVRVRNQKWEIVEITIGTIFFFFFAWDLYSLFFIQGVFKSHLKKSPPTEKPIPTQNSNLISPIWAFWKMAQPPSPMRGGGVGLGIASYVCYTVPEIWHVIVFILGYFFCPFTSLIARKIKIKKKKKRKKSLEISSFYNSIPKIIIICYTVPEIWCVTYVNYFSFWAIFCPFTPMKKMPEDIILHKCTKNHDHIPYCSWDMARDRCNCYFFYFGLSFALLPT